MIHMLASECRKRAAECTEIAELQDDLERKREAEVEPRFDSVAGGFVDGNAVMRAQRGDTLARPAIAVACDQSVPVQDASDKIVVGDQHQLVLGAGNDLAAHC